MGASDVLILVYVTYLSDQLGIHKAVYHAKAPDTTRKPEQAPPDTIEDLITRIGATDAIPAFATLIGIYARENLLMLPGQKPCKHKITRFMDNSFISM